MIRSRSLEQLYAPLDPAARRAARHPWLVVVTCMDPRVRPEPALQVAQSETYVLRNAGGRVTDDVLRSLVFAWSARDVEEIAVVHHADCGLLHGDEAALRHGVEEQLAVDASELVFAAFDDVDASVEADVEVIRTSPFVPDDLPVTGFVFDELTRRVRAVVTDRRSELRAGS